MSSSDNIKALSDQYQSLRSVQGHYMGGDFNEQVDAPNGAKHNVMKVNYPFIIWHAYIADAPPYYCTSSIRRLANVLERQVRQQQTFFRILANRTNSHPPFHMSFHHNISQLCLVGICYRNTFHVLKKLLTMYV
jgi:hypothetical protein